MAASAATVEVVVPPLLSLVLARHRFDEIQPNTVADLLIALLWDRLASGRYRGPSLATVLRRRRRGGRRVCPTNLSALDRECHTLLALCKPPLGRSSAAVRLDDLDPARAFDHYRGALRRELLVFCRACARLHPRRRQSAPSYGR